MQPECVSGALEVKLDFLKVVRLVFWSGAPRFALTVVLRAQKLDL